MTNQEKFLQIFGQDLKRQCSTKSWWEQEYINPQKSGKWIITTFSVTGRHYQCSECKYIHTFTNFEYCPKCGAKMVESQESEVSNG